MTLSRWQLRAANPLDSTVVVLVLASGSIS